MRPKPCIYMGGTANWQHDSIEDIIRVSAIPKHKYEPPSMSKAARDAKDRLEDDPYNLDRILDLGYVYASEAQNDKAANVLIRGWKRASELKDPKERFTFLLKTAEVSFRNKQYKQAVAVLWDIEDPEDYYDKKALQLLSCHAYAEGGENTQAIMTFSKAIEKEEFNSAIKIWAACALALKKAGAHELAKEGVMKKARTDQGRSMDEARVQTVETWSQIGTKQDKGFIAKMISLEDAVSINGNTVPKIFIYATMVFCVLVLFLLLYWAEQRSLASLKM